MPDITGSLLDALGQPTLLGQVIFTPHASTDARTSGTDVFLGSIRHEISDLPDTLTIPTGSWIVRIKPQGQQGGKDVFTELRTTLVMDQNYTWAQIVNGLVTAVPITPTLLQQAEAAATSAEADAQAAAAHRAAVEAVPATSAGVMATVDADPNSVYRQQQDARHLETIGTEVSTPGTPTHDALTATIAAQSVPRWQPSTAYTAGDIVQAPDGSIVERIATGSSGPAYVVEEWVTPTGLAAQMEASTAPRFGPLVMPTGFPTLPCTFYRDNDGVIRHNFDFDAYKPATATHIYLATTGNDTTGTGASGTPYRTLVKAMAVVQASAAGAYVIHMGNIAMFDRDEAGFTGTITGKTVALVSEVEGGTVLTSNTTYAWTADGAGTYKATRSGVTAVVDNGARDYQGMPVPLKKVTSAALCQAEAGTFYAGASEVWVHRRDGALPTHDSTIVTIGVTSFDPMLAGGSKLYAENMVFCGWSNGHGLRVRGAAALVGGETFVSNRCKFVGHNADCYRSHEVAKTYHFESVFAYGQRDGMNYSYDTSTWAVARANSLGVEYNCTAYHLGIEEPGPGSNNASTCHHGGNILRIGTVGYENVGATIIDVNGCRSVNYDVRARDPRTLADPTPGSGTAFTFSADSSGQPGEAWLHDCAAADCTVALNIGSNTVGHVARLKRPTAALIQGGGTLLYDI